MSRFVVNQPLPHSNFVFGAFFQLGISATITHRLPTALQYLSYMQTTVDILLDNKDGSKNDE